VSEIVSKPRATLFLNLSLTQQGPTPRVDKFACKNCGQGGHKAADCEILFSSGYDDVLTRSRQGTTQRRQC
jgi:hypothetical protein